MKIFSNKDKDKKKQEKDKEKGDKLDSSHGITNNNKDHTSISSSSVSIRARTSTSSPSLQASSNSISSSSASNPPPSINPLQGSSAINHSRKDSSDSSSSSGSLGRSSQVGVEKKQQHAIRIGDTRFYGRIICRAKALYDYPLDGDTLQVEDEEIKLLKFKKGDIINVYEQDSSGWWAGEFNEEKGIFPGSYMRVLEEEPVDPKKTKSQAVAREELLHAISTLEAERDEIINSHEKERAEYNRTVKEIKNKSEADLQELKRAIAERDEVITASSKKLRAVEKELDEVTTKLASREVEVMTMELEIQEYKTKLPELLAKQETAKKAQDDKSPRLQGIQAELNAKNQELHEINRQKLEAEKAFREAKAKLQALESQILRKVMTSPIQDSPQEKRGEDLDMLKKQLGEEVFEKRRMENEIREMKRMCVDVENLKTDKAKLEAELANKVELENKLAKIDTILQGLINKDPATLTVPSIKELLSKVRKGIAANPTASSGAALKTSTGLAASGGLGNSGGTSQPTPTGSRPSSPQRERERERATTRPKTATFYKD